MALSWSDITSTPEYVNTLRRLQSQMGRQFKAIPQASPSLREVGASVAQQRLRAQEVGAQTDLAQRALGIREGELDLQRQQLDIGRRQLRSQERELGRYRSQLPFATAISLAGLGLQGLSVVGNIRAAGRAEARHQQLMGIRQQETATQQAAYEAEIQRRRQLGGMYEGFLRENPVPDSLQ